MLERVLAESKEHFLARLVLTQNYLLERDQVRAADQLKFLLSSVPRASLVKDWLILEWQVELRRMQPTSGANTPANMANRANAPASGFTVSAATVDKAARAKLLLHLLQSWSSSSTQADNRAQVAEQIVKWNGIQTLPAARQDELVMYYSSRQDEVGFLQLFDEIFARYQSGPRLTAPLSKDLLNSLPIMARPGNAIWLWFEPRS